MKIAFFGLFLARVARTKATPELPFDKVDHTEGTENRLLNQKSQFDAKIKEMMTSGSKRGQLRGRLSFDELGINDEREAQFFCTSLLNRFSIDIMPEWIDCQCKIVWLKYIDLECQARVCLDEFFGGGKNSTATETTSTATETNSTAIEPNSTATDLLFNGTSTKSHHLANVCVHATYDGLLFAPFLGLKSEVCNGPVEVRLGIPFVPIPFFFKIPKVCATATHNNFNIQKINTCGLRVGIFSCDCSVCPSGQDVTIDCSGALSLLGLRLLSPFMKFECVGLGLLGMNITDGTAIQPFINPLLLIGTRELERRINS